ncbi:MAG: lysylphosphatidylglycerol synthase transmembrane domain-containing protein [Anaerolineae bacterium]
MKSKSFWIRLLLSIGLITFLFYSVDMQHTLSTLANSNPVYLLVALVIAIGDRILMAYKWNLLLREKEINLSLLNGDALRVYAVARGGHRASDVLSSIIVERALGFIALFLFVLTSITLSIFVFGQSFFSGIWNLFWIFVGLLVVFVGGIYLSLRETALRRLMSLLRNSKVREHKFYKKLGEVYYSYHSYHDNLPLLTAFLFLSLLENLFPLSWTYFLSLAFNIEVPLLYFFILIPIVLVLVRLPISLDGIGIQEGAYVYFLSLIGVPKSEALLLGLASHVLGIVSVLPGGVLYGFSGLNVRQPMRLEEIQPDYTAPTKK